MSLPIKIALAGEGGQGVQSIAMILAEAAFDNGKEVIYIPNFGVEQRGGVSIAFVQIADVPIAAPKFKTGDIVVALSSRACERTSIYADRETLFVYDSSKEEAVESLPGNAKRLIPVPAVKLAKEELHPRVFNMIILGTILGLEPIISQKQAEEAIEKKLGYKFQQKPELRELNFKALSRGISLARELL